MKVKLDVMHVTNFEFTVVELIVGTSNTANTGPCCHGVNIHSSLCL